MPSTPNPRAPRLLRVATGSLMVGLLGFSIAVRVVTPLHAAAEPAVPSMPAATAAAARVPTQAAAAPLFPRTPVDQASLANSAATRLVTRPATRASSTPATDEAGSAPAGDLVRQAQAIFESVVPAVWRAAVRARFTIVDGTTSMSYDDGEIELAASHLTRSTALAWTTVAHEWGHQVAYHYGSQAFFGAGPTGFPYDGTMPAEGWADCVANALTGYAIPSHGLSPCTADGLAFAQAFLAAGP